MWVFGNLESLWGDFWWNDVTCGWPPVTRSHDIYCDVTATSCELQPCRSSNVPKTQVFDLLEPVAGPSNKLMSLPGHFQTNYVTSGSHPVTWGHVMSFTVTWLPPPMSWSPVGAETHPNTCFRISKAPSWSLPLKWRHFWVSSGHVRSRDIIFFHVTATSFELKPCSSGNTPEPCIFDHLQPLPGHFRSNNITSRLLPVRGVTWRHFHSWRQPPAS